MFQLVLTGVAVVLSIILSVVGWQRRSLPLARSLLFATSALTIWFIAHFLEVISPSLEAKLLWNGIHAISSAIWSALLVFSLQYTGRQVFPSRRTLLLLAIEPLVFFLLTFADTQHTLVRLNPQLVAAQPFALLTYTRAPLAWADTLYGFGLILITIFLLASDAFHAPRLFQKQTLLLVLAAIFPALIHFSSFIGMDQTHAEGLLPYAYFVMVSFLGYGVLRYQMLDIIPAAGGRLVENMAFGVIVLDRRRRVVYLNPAAQRITKCTQNEVIGSTTLPDLDFTPILSETENQIREISIQCGETKSDFEVCATPIFDRSRSLTGWLIVLNNITESKRLRLSLQESETKYRLVAEGASDGIIIGQDDVYIYVNPQIEQMTGFTSAELIGKPVGFLIAPEVRESVSARYRRRRENTPALARYARDH